MGTQYSYLIEKLPVHKTLRTILSSLYHYHMHQGQAYPSHKTLARISGKSVRAVQYALEKLEELGLISRNKRSYLKTKIYHIHFEQLIQLTSKSAQSLKKFAPKIACEIAHKKKINNKLKIAKAINMNVEKKEGKGEEVHSQSSESDIIDLAHPLKPEILETIVTEVNSKTEKTFPPHYFLRSIQKIKEIDLKKSKTVVVTLKLLIKRLIAWVKRELVSADKVAENCPSISIPQVPSVQSLAKTSMELQEVCNKTQGDHPKKSDIMSTLRSTFERFDRSLSFKSWFKNIVVEKGEGGIACIKWPTSFDRDWVKNNFGTELRYAFSKLGMAYELEA